MCVRESTQHFHKDTRTYWYIEHVYTYWYIELKALGHFVPVREVGRGDSEVKMNSYKAKQREKEKKLLNTKNNKNK